MLDHKLHHLLMTFTSKELFEILFRSPITHHHHFCETANPSFDLHTAFSLSGHPINSKKVFPQPEKAREIACQKAIDKGD
jgi:hypothetical protein